MIAHHRGRDRQMTRIVSAARAAVLALFAVFIVAAALGVARQASAQSSSVRPPAGAVDNVAPPGAGAENPNVPYPGAVAIPPAVDPTASKGTRYNTEMWGDVRKGLTGKVSIGDKGAGQLIQSEGELWRNLRNGKVSTYGGWLLTGVVGFIALYYLLRGRIRIHAGRSGRVIPRFSLTERTVHWFIAGLWLILAITGLVILFGRHVLLPVIGPSAFSLLASASLQAHNLMGPIFAVATLMLIFTFIRGNFFQLVDIKWLLKGGGFFGGHASSDRYNFGEKTWYWLATFAGIVLTVSGFAMLFPDQLGDRNMLQLANIAHALAALAFIAFGIGHIYIATLGMEGALEGMTRGTVDENWAKEHHDLWYEAHKKEATTDRSAAEAEAAMGHV